MLTIKFFDKNEILLSEFSEEQLKKINYTIDITPSLIILIKEFNKDFSLRNLLTSLEKVSKICLYSNEELLKTILSINIENMRYTVQNDIDNEVVEIFSIYERGEN